MVLSPNYFFQNQNVNCDGVVEFFRIFQKSTFKSESEYKAPILYRVVIGAMLRRVISTKFNTELETTFVLHANCLCQLRPAPYLDVELKPGQLSTVQLSIEDLQNI